MKKIYISGQITGLKLEESYRLFHEAEAELIKLGHEPVNPMKLIPYDPLFSWEDYMIKDIEILLKCDGIYMLRNWGVSRGARIEHFIAVESNKQTLYQAMINIIVN